MKVKRLMRLVSVFRHFAVGTLVLSFIGSSASRSLAGKINLSLLPGASATATGADYGSSISDAIDGNRDGNFYAGSVFYANAAAPPLFYQVDLGQNAYIDRVQALRRTDTNDGVFGNMRLSIFPDDGFGNPAAVPSFQHDYQTSAFTYGTWGTVDPGASAPGGANGRFVRLERLDNNYWLTFSEFEVIGSLSPMFATETNNLAAGKPVTTLSPPGYGATITSGNDSNINGDFNDPAYSVYHSTNYGPGEYWRVDLGAEKALDFAELFARSGMYTTSQYKVSVLDSSLNVVGSVIVDNADPNGPNPGWDHTVDLSGLTGRYVQVQPTGDQYLSFTELRVFGAVPEPSSLVLVSLGLLAYPRRFKRRR